METLVALRKKPRLRDMLQEIASVVERRTRVMERAADSQHTPELEKHGFRPVMLDEHGAETVSRDEPWFGRLGYIGAYVLNVPDREPREAAKAVLGNDYYLLPNIELTLPPPLEASIDAPVEERPRREWSKASGVGAAHRQGARGQGVRVGVLDTGCDADHEQFKGKSIEFLYVNPADAAQSRAGIRAFDPHGHGTHVCGIIAGREVGVAPEAELMVASVIESENTQTSLERIVYALNWMVSQFQEPEARSMPTIINLSLGFQAETLSQTKLKALVTGVRSIIHTLVYDLDILPIVAIGNDGPGLLRAPGYFPEVLAVGAVDLQHQPAAFSGGGVSPLDHQLTKPDLVGYGVDILSAVDRDSQNRSRYARKTGTSMAAPYVAGIAALYASARPNDDLQGAKLRDTLIQTALTLDGTPDRIGKGLARFTKDGL